jgi:hypothetical protein
LAGIPLNRCIAQSVNVSRWAKDAQVWIGGIPGVVVGTVERCQRVGVSDGSLFLGDEVGIEI